MDGGDGQDMVSYAGSTEGVTVNLLTGIGHGGSAEGDTYLSIESVKGSAHDDRLTGDAASNVLLGLAGDDTLIGGSGNDTLVGGDGQDIAVFSGRRADYLVSVQGLALRLVDTRERGDGIDLTVGIETYRFSDGDVAASELRQSGAGFAYDWRLFAGDGLIALVGGIGLVSGSNDSQLLQILDRPGTITLDTSFNRGGDVLILPHDAIDWTIMQSASSAVLGDGDTFVIVPLGTAGITIQFDDGIRRLAHETSLNGAIIGTQLVSDLAQSIEAPPHPVWPLPTFPTEAHGRLFLAAGAEVTVAAYPGHSLSITGTNGAETVTVITGVIVLDSSFNRGGDVVIVGGDAAEFTATALGSQLQLRGGELDLTIPVGTTGIDMRFADQTLLLAALNGQIMLGTHVIDANGITLG